MPWMVKWAGPFPLYVETAAGAHFACVDGHDYVDFCLGDTGRHGRPRPGADDRRGRTAAPPRRHAHAPDRGCRLGRRGADPTVRRRVVAVRAVGDRCQSLGAPPRAPHHAVAPRSSSTTIATTGPSTRRSRSSTSPGRVVPVRGSVGPQVDVAQTTRVVEFNDVDGLAAALADRRRRGGADRARTDQCRDRAARTRLPRSGPRDHPAHRHAS